MSSALNYRYPAIQGDDGIMTELEEELEEEYEEEVESELGRAEAAEEDELEGELEDEFEGEAFGGLDRALGGFLARGSEGEEEVEVEAEAELESEFDFEAEAESEAEVEGEEEEEGEEEGEAFVNPIRRIYRDAELMAHLSTRAAQTESEAEAEAFVAALVPIAGRLIPRAARVVTRNAPMLIRGVGQLTRQLRRNPATRRFVTAIPVILQRTAQSLADQAARGRPITTDIVLRTLTAIAARVLGRPARRRRAVRAVGVFDAETAPRPAVAAQAPPTAAATAPAADSAILPSYLAGQSLNVRRHLNALRDFTRAEFGTGIARPSEGHIQAVNRLLAALRRPLHATVEDLERASRAARRAPSRSATTRLLELKTQAHDWVRATEKVWDFYFELFGQRQSAFGDWLVACDRIALDCYQHVYMHLGSTPSIPAPPPFSYMRTGFSPATFRRGIPLRRLGRQLNPFPLVQLPYHRMVNPWTMGAVLHEVSHNLQNELRLERLVPLAIRRLLRRGRIPEAVSRVWVRWNREIFGDMLGVMLGGEAFVASLMDVIGRAPSQALAYTPHNVHPTPYLRTFLSCELLSRMGFPDRAQEFRRAWRQLYPSTEGSTIPREVLGTWPRAVPLVVEAVCYTRFPSLGSKALREVITFEPRHQLIIEEAAGRLAKGVDPGVVPERFLIGAVRTALDRRLAPADRLMRNFYVELSRR